MNASPWNLSGDTASLTTEKFSASVDLRKPSEGVREIALDGETLPGLNLFGLYHETDAPLPVVGLPVEQFIRLEDLFARFPQTDEQRFSPSIYWRALNEATDPPGVRLIGSIQTDLLDAHPDLLTRSTIPAKSISRLVSETRSAWQSVDVSPQGTCRIDEADTPYCLLLRLPDAPISYAEMIHPVDFRGVTIVVRQETDAQVFELTSPLLTRWMEKGVILRARAQGVFVPREHDERLAYEAYHRFMQAELPLTV